MATDRMLIITPVRDEAAHLERVAGAMAAQTRPPDLWLVVDDGSTDGTAELAARLAAGIPFLRVLSAPRAPASRDRLASAAPPRAFNFGVRAAGGPDAWTHIGKLDGDIELPPTYFEALLAEFAADPDLGIGGGTLVELHGETWRPAPSAADHVRGALKLYSRPCLDAIGGVQEVLGWDGLDETVARMCGWRTCSFTQLVARHHRVTGSANGRLRGHARWGAGHYALHYGPLWVLARSMKVALSRPRGLSGAAYLYGYARAAVVRAPRAGDADYRRFVRRERRERACNRLLHRSPRTVEAGTISMRSSHAGTQNAPLN